MIARSPSRTSLCWMLRYPALCSPQPWLCSPITKSRRVEEEEEEETETVVTMHMLNKNYIERKKTNESQSRLSLKFEKNQSCRDGRTRLPNRQAIRGRYSLQEPIVFKGVSIFITPRPHTPIGRVLVQIICQSIVDDCNQKTLWRLLYGTNRERLGWINIGTGKHRSGCLMRFFVTLARSWGPSWPGRPLGGAFCCMWTVWSMWTTQTLQFCLQQNLVVSSCESAGLVLPAMSCQPRVPKAAAPAATELSGTSSRLLTSQDRDK